jgi:NADH-quinone oxidoreductase subunit E
MKTVERTKTFEMLTEILDKYGNNPAKLIPILQETQDVYRYLPEEVMAFVATSLKIPPSKVYGVATFYSHFSLTPKGKYVIKVCDGTACHVKRSTAIIDAIKDKLKLDSSKNTTDDMNFTLEIVSCLGACGLAPVVVVNEDVYGQMTPDKMNAVIDKINAKESGKDVQ